MAIDRGVAQVVLEQPTSDSEDEDLSLMRRVAARDVTAQRALVERFAARVRRRAKFFLRQSTDAEDAAQMTLLEVLRSAGGFGPPGNLDAWVDRIAARTALRHSRKLHAERSLGQRILDLLPLPTRLDPPDGPLVAGRLEGYLGCVRVEQREAFVLHYAFGYSVDEIVELTGAPRGTVKGRIGTARKELRRMIETDFERGSSRTPAPWGNRSRTEGETGEEP